MDYDIKSWYELYEQNDKLEGMIIIYQQEIEKLELEKNELKEEILFLKQQIEIQSTEEDINKFMDKTNDKTYLLYDTGHLLFAKADNERVLKNYISRINHIHCKDIRKNILKQSLDQDMSFRDSFLNGIFTVPGDGCIDYMPLIKVLHEKKYENWLVIEAEQDPKKANPLQYAKIGNKYLTKILIDIGYKI